MNPTIPSNDPLVVIQADELEAEAKEIFEYLNSLSLKKDFIYKNYSQHDNINRNYFTIYNAMKCDTIRIGIDQSDNIDGVLCGWYLCDDRNTHTFSKSG